MELYSPHLSKQQQKKALKLATTTNNNVESKKIIKWGENYQYLQKFPFQTHL